MSMKVWKYEYEIMTIGVSIKVEYVLIIIIGYWILSSSISCSVFIY